LPLPTVLPVLRALREELPIRWDHVDAVRRAPSGRRLAAQHEWDRVGVVGPVPLFTGPLDGREQLLGHYPAPCGRVRRPLYGVTASAIASLDVAQE
jgi:hypothetical protein